MLNLVLLFSAGSCESPSLMKKPASYKVRCHYDGKIYQAIFVTSEMDMVINIFIDKSNYSKKFLILTLKNDEKCAAYSNICNNLAIFLAYFTGLCFSFFSLPFTKSIEWFFVSGNTKAHSSDFHMLCVITYVCKYDKSI